MTTKTKQKDGHEVEIVNFGPSDVKMSLKPGFNLLTGRNGAGKTRNLLALGWAMGADLPVTMRHGCDKAWVNVDGQRIRTLEKPMLHIGDVELALNGSNPISDIICPDVKDPKRAEPRRVEALLSLVDVPVTEEAIAVLVNDDENVVDYLSEVEPDLLKCSVVTVADRIAKRSHELKRRWLAQASEQQGRIDAVRVEKPEDVTTNTVEGAQRRYEEAVGDHRQLSGEASQRAERERERQTVGGLGVRPDVDAAYKRKQDAIAAHNALSDEITELKKILFSKQNELILLSKAANEAEMTHSVAKQDAEHWDQRKAILETPITGATQADVEKASLRVQEARQELERARATQRWQEAAQQVKQAQEARDTANSLAKKYETLAQGVTGRLSLLLEKAGLKSLTVSEGKLCYVHEGGKLEPFTDLSFGQRTRAIMPLLEKREWPYGIIVLPRTFYDGLDGEARKEVGEIFASKSLSIVVEEPGEGGLQMVNREA
jgi:hypothetical protein